MKQSKVNRNYLILLLLACSLALSCKTRQVAPPQRLPLSLSDLREKYTVTRIDSVKNVFVIYASSASTQYKIVSLNDSTPCNRIQVGTAYPFSLMSIVPKTLNGIGISPRSTPHVSAIDFHGVGISFDPAYNSDVFVAINLKGLCL